MIEQLRVIAEDDSAVQIYRDWANDYLSQSLIVQRSEGEDTQPEDFLAEELAVAATIGYAFSKKAAGYAEDVLGHLERYDLDRATDVIRTAAGELDEVFDDTVSGNVRRALERESLKGAAAADALEVFRGMTFREQVLDGMVKSTKYYTNNYFNTFVVPSLQDAIEKNYILGAGGEEAYRTVQELLNTRLRTVPYWRVVANAAASRSYHYGLLKSGSMAGSRGYRLRAVIDGKTSKTCKGLDGKEFWIADAVQLIERTAQAADPTEVKELQPWLKYNDIKDLSTADLVSRGVMVPPFHGNCRTTLELMSGF